MTKKVVVVVVVFVVVVVVVFKFHWVAVRPGPHDMSLTRWPILPVMDDRYV
jgi:hypothetical protein